MKPIRIEHAHADLVLSIVRTSRHATVEMLGDELARQACYDIMVNDLAAATEISGGVLMIVGPLQVRDLLPDEHDDGLRLVKVVGWCLPKNKVAKRQ